LWAQASRLRRIACVCTVWTNTCSLTIYRVENQRFLFKSKKQLDCVNKKIGSESCRFGITR